jgi:GT2 family glycosyltransferase
MNASAPAQSPPSAPRITVVVLSRNHVRQTVDTVARLTALPEAPAVIVADNGSSDATVSLLASLFPRVRIVQGLRDLGAAGFNRAIALVTTDYVACCDDSTWWAPGSLARAVRLLDANPRVAVLNARIVGDDEREIHPGCLMLNATSPGLDGLGDVPLPGPALAYYMARASILRTRVFRSIGGYDERLAGGAAEELTALDVLSAGHAIVYCEEALAHREPLSQWMTRAQHCEHARNSAWVAWMRLPVRDAISATGRALAVFARQHSLGPAGISLVRGAFWALPRRRVVPRDVALLNRVVRRAERHVRAGIPAMAEKPDRSGQRAW